MYSKATRQDWSRESTMSPKLGDGLYPDGWPVWASAPLEAGESACMPGFPGSQFRVTASRFTAAVNVTRTGHNRRTDDGVCIRVRIEWVGDCEPSTFSRGWLVRGEAGK